MVGSLGLTSGGPAPVSDSDAIIEGGQTFADRMKMYTGQLQALADRKAEADKSLAALNLGNNIASVQAKAKADSEKAEKVLKEAQDTLKNAKAEAANIVGSAQSKADGIVAAALKSADDAKAKLDAANNESAEAAAQMKKETKEALASAKKKQAAIQKDLDDAKRAKADAESAKYAAEEAQKAAEDARRDYENRVAKLRAVIS